MATEDDLDDIYGDLAPAVAPSLPARQQRNTDSLGNLLSSTPLSGSGYGSSVQVYSDAPRDPRLRDTSGRKVVEAEGGHTTVAAAEPDTSWHHHETIVVEAGEFRTPPRARPASPKASPVPRAVPHETVEDEPMDFEQLRQELLKEDKEEIVNSRDAADEGSDAVDDEEDASSSEGGDQEVSVELGEVHASSTGVASYFAPRVQKPRPGQSANTGADLTHQRQPDNAATGTRPGKKRRETPLFLGPPPPMTAQRRTTPDSTILVGMLPWWLSDSELRKHAEHFGPVRIIRMLENVRSGKSAGVALIEYLQVDAAKAAASPSKGLSTLAVWQTLDTRPPSLVLLSSELFNKVHAGTLSWADGGACSDSLRTILMRQFDLSHQPGGSGHQQAHKASRNLNRSWTEESAGLQRKRSSSTGPIGRGNVTASLERQDTDGSWQNALRALKGKVNRADSVGPPEKKRRP
mmetsp:Transcript_72627/g.135676  ORF Transcript_72627/g.135676 Transcript_72627/m.135676 type:complete len:463 (-) Transcript_72627:87-1475(-)